MKKILLFALLSVSVMSCKKAEELQEVFTPQSGFEIQVEYKDSGGYLNGVSIGGQGHGVYVLLVDDLSGIRFFRTHGSYTNITIIRDQAYITKVGNVDYLGFK